MEFLKFLVLCCTLFNLETAQAVLPLFPVSLAKHPNVTKLSQKPFTFDRIVGGDLAKEGDFKYQASIQRYISDTRCFHYCGGSLVSKRVVLSAAHCAKGQNPRDIRICLGSNTIGVDKCILLEVQEIIIHESYNYSTIENDISAFILKESLELEKLDLVDIVNLPSPDNKDLLKEGTKCVVSGWGTQEEGGDVSKALRYVEVPIVSDKYCKECYGEEEITESMICAGIAKGGKDSCQGDSGGPLVHKESNTLVGVTSWGYGCGRPAYPGVYTKLAVFLDWIGHIIKNYT